MKPEFLILVVAVCAVSLVGCKVQMDDSESGAMGMSTDGSNPFAALTEKPVLVVTGLSTEATIAASFGVTTISSGGNAINLQNLMAQYNSSNIRGVVSFGIAGGLDPSLQPGDVVVLTSVTEGGVLWPANTALTAAVAAKISAAAGSSFSVRQAAGASSTSMILDASGKAQLWNLTHTETVDMESEMAAAFAARNGLPFIAVRAVADPYNQTQPPAATIALLPDGSVNLSAVLNSIATSPTQLPALWTVALQTEAAFSALTKAREAVDFAAVFP